MKTKDLQILTFPLFPLKPPTFAEHLPMQYPGQRPPPPPEPSTNKSSKLLMDSQPGNKTFMFIFLILVSGDAPKAAGQLRLSTNPVIPAGCYSTNQPIGSPTNVGHEGKEGLIKHGVDSGFLETIAGTGSIQDLRDRAFETLVERQHRPTIERALARLTDIDLKVGDVRLPRTSPLDWIVSIKSDFAWNKLEKLRAGAVQLELPMTVGLLTNALAGINRSKTASLIRKQVALAPESWRSAQMAHAIEQEREAKIEAAQRTPFQDVLKKLKGSTSISSLKVLCEGPTDRPTIKSLIGQIGSPSNIIFGSVGGWANLRAEPDPNVWLHGCKEAVMIMDGDLGRHLEKSGKPYTPTAKEEMRKLSAYPITFRVLERYGIENYFPQHIIEKVIGADLSSYFPIPDYASVIERLSPLYSKGRNEDVANHLKLEDLKGTDLLKIVQDICDRAMRLLDE